MEIWRCNVCWIWQMNQNTQPSCNSFCLIIKETYGLGLSWWKIIHVLGWCECFFQLAQLKVLVGINRLVFWRELIIEDSLPVPPFTQHHLLWMKTRLWCGCWWFISLAPVSSIPYFCAVFTLHRPSQFVLKMRCFCYV